MFQRPTDPQPRPARRTAGDALALYLPMTPHSVALYLAAVLAGCVVVSVADSFSAEELRTRLDIAGAVGLFTQVGRWAGRGIPVGGLGLMAGWWEVVQLVRLRAGS